MKNNILSLSILIFLLLVTACDKKNIKSPTGKMLQAGRWQITASVLNIKTQESDTTIDYYNEWKPCEQDDFLEFYKKGKALQTKTQTNAKRIVR